ncbi:MAG: 5-formyltetrahydrofolate cyclo-ligase [Chlamydiae bacterium]|nr:5-formyltetrahydrofolate cyclo-ligase [Chlamydiota bacterium]MBI3265701.1 5-formyltetrahydrofolate cyclo-ligase [Chlamydiota bacterium]
MAEVSKENIRKTFLEARKNLSEDERRFKNLAIQERFLSLEIYRAAKKIFFYCSKSSEVDTLVLIQEALKAGKKVALPLCLSNDLLEARYIEDLERDCERGNFGILSPKKSTLKAVKDELECWVIPGIAFDLSGNRLGWGRGFFDRYLADLKPSQKKIALVYEVQIAPALPVDLHDVKMDVLVTEKREVFFNPKSKIQN